MAEEKQDVTENSSSPLAQAIAESPAAQEQIEQQAQGTETGTPQQPESQEQAEQQAEESRVPYSRFKDVVEEKNYYRQQVEALIQRQQAPQQPQQPTTPQEIGNTPEEREFWRMQRQIAREEAERVSKEQLGRINPVIDAGRQELAMLKVQQFRSQHPDVKPNSPEEMAIAERISSGYLPEDAYKVVMWDRKVEQAEKQANTNVKQKIEAKKQANVEQRSIPQGGTAPTGRKETQIQMIERIAKENGI